MSSLRHGSTRRHLPNRGHCMKEGRRSGADGSPSHELGGYELKGKNEQEGRQQTIEITENRGERVQMNVTHLQSYIICIFCLSAFHSKPSLFFLICSPLKSIHFPCFSNCLLLLSPILCPFPTLLTCLFSNLPVYFFLHAALSVSLTLGGYTGFFPPLFPGPWLFPGAHSLEEKYFCTCFTFKV